MLLSIAITIIFTAIIVSFLIGYGSLPRYASISWFRPVCYLTAGVIYVLSGFLIMGLLDSPLLMTGPESSLAMFANASITVFALIFYSPIFFFSGFYYFYVGKYVLGIPCLGLGCIPWIFLLKRRRSDTSISSTVQGVFFIPSENASGEGQIGIISAELPLTEEELGTKRSAIWTKIAINSLFILFFIMLGVTENGIWLLPGMLWGFFGFRWLLDLLLSTFRIEIEVNLDTFGWVYLFGSFFCSLFAMMIIPIQIFLLIYELTKLHGFSFEKRTIAVGSLALTFCLGLFLLQFGVSKKPRNSIAKGGNRNESRKIKKLHSSNLADRNPLSRATARSSGIRLSPCSTKATTIPKIVYEIHKINSIQRNRRKLSNEREGSCSSSGPSYQGIVQFPSKSLRLSCSMSLGSIQGINHRVLRIGQKLYGTISTGQCHETLIISSNRPEKNYPSSKTLLRHPKIHSERNFRMRSSKRSMARKKPHIVYKRPKQWMRRSVYKWRRAWERTARYNSTRHFRKYYHPRFYDKKLKKRYWGYMRYKRKIARKYRWIRVKITELHLLHYSRRKWTIRFKQHYKTPKFSDKGYKTLVWRKYRRRWRIWRETWSKN